MCLSQTQGYSERNTNEECEEREKKRERRRERDGGGACIRVCQVIPEVRIHVP